MSNFSSLKNMWENLAKEGKQNNVPPIKVLPSKNKTVAPVCPQLSQNGSQSNSINTPIVETQISKESIIALRNNLEGKINIGVPSMPKTQNLNTIVKTPSRSSDETGSQNISMKVQVPTDQRPQTFEKMPNFKQLRAGVQQMFEKKLSGTNNEQQSQKINKDEEENRNFLPQESKEIAIQRILSQSNTSSTLAIDHYQGQNQQITINENGSNNFPQESLSLRRKKTKKTVVQNFDDL